MRILPTSRIEVTSSAMWSSSNTSRGCRGLGGMSPTGISRRTAMSADTVPSVATGSAVESAGSFLDDVAEVARLLGAFTVGMAGRPLVGRAAGAAFWSRAHFRRGVP